MEVMNARIENVTVGLDDRDRLSVRMCFNGGWGCEWGFILTNPIDSQRLIKLMEYTRTSDVLKLNGKIVRMVTHDCFFRGFGDPISNKFVPAFGEELQEITEEDFKKLLEKTKGITF